MNYKDEYIRQKKKYIKLRDYVVNQFDQSGGGIVETIGSTLFGTNFENSSGGDYKTGIQNLGESCYINSLSQLLVEIPDIEKHIDVNKFPNYVRFLNRLRRTNEKFITNDFCDKVMRQDIGYSDVGSAPETVLSKLEPTCCIITVVYDRPSLGNPNERLTRTPAYLQLSMGDNVQDAIQKTIREHKIYQLTVPNFLFLSIPSKNIGDSSVPQMTIDQVNNSITVSNQHFTLIGATFTTLSGRHETVIKKVQDGWRYYNDSEVKGPYKILMEAYQDNKWIGNPSLLLYKKINEAEKLEQERLKRRQQRIEEEERLKRRQERLEKYSK